MYLMLKIKIFKMQLLKNYTANPINSTCSYSMLSPCFRGVLKKKINVKRVEDYNPPSKAREVIKDKQYRKDFLASLLSFGFLPAGSVGSKNHVWSVAICIQNIPRDPRSNIHKAAPLEATAWTAIIPCLYPPNDLRKENFKNNKQCEVQTDNLSK